MSFLWQPFFIEKKTEIMKTIKHFKIASFVAGIFIAIIAIMSFNKTEKEEKAVVGTYYFYVSEEMSEGDFRNVSHWSTVNDATPCGGIVVRPCKVLVPNGSSLSAVLGSKTNSQVLGISEGFKPNP